MDIKYKLDSPGSDWSQYSDGRLRGLVREVWWRIRSLFETLEDWAQNRWFQTFRLIFTAAAIWWAYKHIHRENLIGKDGLLDLKQLAKAVALTTGAASVFAILWADRISDGLGGFFMQLLDSSDSRAIEMHPMDRINSLIKDGKTSRARRLCRQMIRQRAGDPAVFRAILEQLDDRRIRLGPRLKRIRGSK